MRTNDCRHIVRAAEVFWREYMRGFITHDQLTLTQERKSVRILRGEIQIVQRGEDDKTRPRELAHQAPNRRLMFKIEVRGGFI
jgi:hypothetical protein